MVGCCVGSGVTDSSAPTETKTHLYPLVVYLQIRFHIGINVNGVINLSVLIWSFTSWQLETVSLIFYSVLVELISM